MKQQKYLQTAFDKASFDTFGNRRRNEQAQAGNIIKKGWQTIGTVLVDEPNNRIELGLKHYSSSAN